MFYLFNSLPVPEIPRLDLMKSLIVDSLIIGIVSFAVLLSLAKIYAKKNKYKINPNQELIAIGSANIFSSFFSCYPCAASLSRSSVQEKTGGKTQIASLVSCIIILVVLLFLGPLFYHLPKVNIKLYCNKHNLIEIFCSASFHPLFLLH